MTLPERPNKHKKIILIVNGYGCHIDTPLGWEYLPKVARFIKENMGNILGIIFCGGYTQRLSAPMMSEAKLMHSNLRNVGLLGWAYRIASSRHGWVSWYMPDLRIIPSDILLPDIIIESGSYTSFENSKMAAKIIPDLLAYDSPEEYFRKEDIRIVHFCEATRAANVIMLDRHFMIEFVESIDDITVETGSWERANPIKQAGNLIHNWLAIKFPWLKLAERASETQKRKSQNR